MHNALLPHLSSALIPGVECCQNRGKCQDVLWCKADFQDNGEMPQEEEEAECWDSIVWAPDISWYCASLMHLKFATGAVVLCKLDTLAPH